MRSPESLSAAELAEESVVRWSRLLVALAVAIGLCVTGFGCCFAFFLITSAPRRAFERATEQAVWIWPFVMIIILPIALGILDRLRARRHHEQHNA